MITLYASGCDLSLTHGGNITAGMVGLHIKIGFGAEWSGLGKTVVVTDGAVTKDITEAQWISGSEFVVPHECMTTANRKLRIGVYGADGEATVIPTVWCAVGVILPGTDPSGDTEIDDTPGIVASVTAQASAAAASAESALVAKTAAETARGAAEAAQAGAEETKQSIITEEAERATAETERVTAEATRQATYEGFAGNVAGALRGTTEASTAIRKDDISPLAHNLDITQYGICNVSGTPRPETPATITGRTAGGKAYGKNLLPYPYRETTKTVNGITFTDNGDGTITANGTATSIADFSIATNFEIPAGCKILGLANSSGTTFEIQAYKSSAEYISTNDSTRTVENSFFATFVRFRIRTGVTVNNLVANPMLLYGAIPTSSEPYKTPISYTVTDSNGDPVILYGIPVTTGGNVTVDGQQYISDYIKGGQVHRKIGGVDLGTFNWSINIQSGVSCFKADSNGFIKADIVSLCTNYVQVKTWDSTVFKHGAYRIATGSIKIVDDRYTGAAAFKTAMSGVMLYYELAEETISPVTVSTASAIAPTTTFLADCPTEITYNRDINKAFAELQALILNN